jgi:hypothetical protein
MGRPLARTGCSAAARPLCIDRVFSLVSLWALGELQAV